jgi:hypothetical protein
MQAIGEMFYANPTISIDIFSRADVMAFVLLMFHKGVEVELTRATSMRLPITGGSSAHDKERNQCVKL